MEDIKQMIDGAIKNHETRMHKKRAPKRPKAEMSYTPAFESFWKLFRGRWNPKEGEYGSFNKGSKIEAFGEWNKLSQADQQKAIKGAPFSAGQYTQDCCRWLKYKRWEK